jgi:hypothetical protein
MVIERIYKLLESCTTETPLFPPTILYNEGWLLRLTLDWFSSNKVPNHPLNFHKRSRWFSEALLPSTFQSRYRGDQLAENRTHADGVVGHFSIGEKGKADLSLTHEATQLLVLEAKMFSSLSSGVTNAKYFDQAARNVACIAEVFHRAKLPPRPSLQIGFYVLAPNSQIEQGKFSKEMERSSIEQKVEQRVQEYGGDKDDWYSEWFQPIFQLMEIQVISWEKLILSIAEHEPETADRFDEFYRHCIEFNLTS